MGAEALLHGGEIVPLGCPTQDRVTVGQDDEVADPVHGQGKAFSSFFTRQHELDSRNRGRRARTTPRALRTGAACRCGRSPSRSTGRLPPRRCTRTCSSRRSRSPRGGGRARRGTMPSEHKREQHPPLRSAQATLLLIAVSSRAYAFRFCAFRAALQFLRDDPERAHVAVDRLTITVSPIRGTARATIRSNRS